MDDNPAPSIPTTKRTLEDDFVNSDPKRAKMEPDPPAKEVASDASNSRADAETPKTTVADWNALANTNQLDCKQPTAGPEEVQTETQFRALDASNWKVTQTIYRGSSRKQANDPTTPHGNLKADKVSSGHDSSKLQDDDQAETATFFGSGSKGPAADFRQGGGKGKRDRRKERGQNKNRQFGTWGDKILLCNSRALRPEFSPDHCPFGDKCRLEHDLRKYLAEGKSEDLNTLDGRCPIWEARGFCHSGWKCRFVGSHSTERETDDGRKELILLEDENRKSGAGIKGTSDANQRAHADEDVFNITSNEAKTSLARRWTKTPRSDKYIAWLTDQWNQKRLQPENEQREGKAGFDSFNASTRDLDGDAAGEGQKSNLATAMTEEEATGSTVDAASLRATTHGTLSKPGNAEDVANQSEEVGFVDARSDEAVTTSSNKGEVSASQAGDDMLDDASASEAPAPLNAKDYVNNSNAGDTMVVEAPNDVTTSKTSSVEEAATNLISEGAVPVDNTGPPPNTKEVDKQDQTANVGKGEEVQYGSAAVVTVKAEKEDRRAAYMKPPFLPSEKRRLYYGADTPVLAPLTTQGNLPFRRLCVELGAQLTWSEMAMGMPLLQGHKSEWALMKCHSSEITPPTVRNAGVIPSYDNSKDLKFGVQIAANKPWVAVKTTEIISTHLPYVRAIDLNCGCPIDLVYENGAGSALLDAHSKLEKMIRGMNSLSGEIPITAKIRMGTRDKEPTADKVVNRLLLGGHDAQQAGLGPAGVAAITLHGRSRQQRYTREADWSYIADIAALVNRIQRDQQAIADTAAEPDARQLPNGGKTYFLGNGDCFSHEDYYAHLEQAGVDGVMIGRGALIKPWLFEEIASRQYLDKSASERLGLVERFARFGLECWGSDETGVGTTRRFLLEWLSFAHRYIPIGLLERLPPKLNERPRRLQGRNELETLLASDDYRDWIRISEMFLGPAHEGFRFTPKHKSHSYDNVDIVAEG